MQAAGYCKVQWTALKLYPHYFVSSNYKTLSWRFWHTWISPPEGFMERNWLGTQGKLKLNLIFNVMLRIRSPAPETGKAFFAPMMSNFLSVPSVTLSDVSGREQFKMAVGKTHVSAYQLACTRDGNAFPTASLCPCFHGSENMNKLSRTLSDMIYISLYIYTWQQRNSNGYIEELYRTREDMDNKMVAHNRK